MGGVGEAVPLKKWVSMCVLGEAGLEFANGSVRTEKGDRVE